MVGDYERVGVVARGAHSTIWKGFDPGLKREVALKQLSGSGAGEAARREAAALAGLRHPNILSVYDVLEDAEGVWLIEQWITGAPLSAVLAVTGKLRGIDALALIHGALQGLSYAHGRDVVHGDVTPGNILIDQSGTPMLVDFGLAVAPGQLSLGGTPGYMAPEAAAGQPVDKRSDVYSSCVVLAELLRGARLFTTASSLALTREQASAAPQLDGIEAPVAAVLSTGLHPRPEERPTDAQTLLTQLESAIEKTHGRRWLAAAGTGRYRFDRGHYRRRNHPDRRHGHHRNRCEHGRRGQTRHLDAHSWEGHRRSRNSRRRHRSGSVGPVTPRTAPPDRGTNNDTPARRRYSRDPTGNPTGYRRHLPVAPNQRRQSVMHRS